MIGMHKSVENWSWEQFEDVVINRGLKIFTLSGSVHASIGDYIMKGVEGECYPCRPEIFKKTYIEVEDE